MNYVTSTPEIANDVFLITSKLSTEPLGPIEGPFEPEWMKIFKEARQLNLLQTTITGKSLTFLITDIESLIVIVRTSHMCKAIEKLRRVQPLDINTCTALQYSTALVETLKLSYDPIPKQDDGNAPTTI